MRPPSPRKTPIQTVDSSQAFKKMTSPKPTKDNQENHKMLEQKLKLTSGTYLSQTGPRFFL